MHNIHYMSTLCNNFLLKVSPSFPKQVKPSPTNFTTYCVHHVTSFGIVWMEWMPCLCSRLTSYAVASGIGISFTADYSSIWTAGVMAKTVISFDTKVPTGRSIEIGAAEHSSSGLQSDYVVLRRSYLGGCPLEGRAQHPIKHHLVDLGIVRRLYGNKHLVRSLWKQKEFHTCMHMHTLKMVLLVRVLFKNDSCSSDTCVHNIFRFTHVHLLWKYLFWQKNYRDGFLQGFHSNFDIRYIHAVLTVQVGPL